MNKNNYNNPHSKMVLKLLENRACVVTKQTVCCLKQTPPQTNKKMRNLTLKSSKIESSPNFGKINNKQRGRAPPHPEPSDKKHNNPPVNDGLVLDQDAKFNLAKTWGPDSNHFIGPEPNSKHEPFSLVALLNMLKTLVS